MSYPLATDDQCALCPWGNLEKEDDPTGENEGMEIKKLLRNNQLEQGRGVLTSLNFVHSHE